jgi:hypothetical protein
LEDRNLSGKGFHEITVVNDKDGKKLALIDRFPGGRGKNTDQNSVLVRPYRTAIEEGRPIGSIKHVLVKKGDLYYVLGVFVTTVSHLLFFPGDTGRLLIRPPGPQIKGGTNHAEEVIVDHLTLESNLKSWHIKMSNREIKYGAMRSGKVDDAFYLWFQMQIGSLDQLESLPLENHIYLNIDPARAKDLIRLLPMIKNSRNLEINVIPLNEKISKEEFWAFQFFVTKSRDATFTQVRRVNVNRPPYVIVNDAQTGKGDIRAQVKLESFGSIWIRAYTVNGTVHECCFMISGEELVD